MHLLSVFYIIYKATRRDPPPLLLFVCVLPFFPPPLIKTNCKAQVISYRMTSAALFTCSTKRVRQTLIALSNASGCVCVRGRCKAVVHISPVYSLPCARMSAKSFRLVRQLPGDQQEAVRECKHRLCLDPSCRRPDIFENAKTSPQRA